MDIIHHLARAGPCQRYVLHLNCYFAASPAAQAEDDSTGRSPRSRIGASSAIPSLFPPAAASKSPLASEARAVASYPSAPRLIVAPLPMSYSDSFLKPCPVTRMLQPFSTKCG